MKIKGSEPECSCLFVGPENIKVNKLYSQVEIYIFYPLTLTYLPLNKKMKKY